MEPWQVSHIQRNKYNLQRLTICNGSFRAVLEEHGVLGGNDISQLEAVRDSKGKHDESELLYNLLVTREGAFNALIDACDRTQQTGALRILKQVHISKSTTWNKLPDELKNELSNKLVGFQGNKVKLSECCNHLHHLITGEFLEQLEKGSTSTLVNNQLPDQVDYYIQRTLRSRSKLKSSVFQHPCNDVFVVDGSEKYHLTNLVGGAETAVSGNQINGLTVRFILLEYERDFESICKLSSSPVHLIRYKNEVYEWVRSSGSVKTLQKHVDEAQDCFLEVELASRENRVHVIPDSPGMGKTLLLANVAHQISKEKPNVLIRFLLMKEVVEAMSKIPITLGSVLCLIAEQSSDFKCGREIVKHILTSEPCILMFDGFDEVLIHQIDIAKQILETIVTLKSAQIFVTTRPHMRDELENTLYALGYTINPFTESDQVDFLLKFWKMKGVQMNENMKQFATSCVNTISSNMTDFERDIAGIPLQCRLLAECYTEQAVRWSQTGALSINSQPVDQINSIFEMYERHIKIRLDNWKINVEAIKNVYMYYALELLFPKNAHQFQELKTSSVSVNELCALGFFEVSNSGDIRFVHRTFAEFFVAWFAVEMNMPEKIRPFLLDELLVTKANEEFIPTPFGKTSIGTSQTFIYPVLAYFINGFSKMFSTKYGSQDQTHRISKLMDSVYYGQISRIFLASACSDYQFVPQAVSLCFDTSQLNQKGELNVYELLLVSAKYSSVALMNIFCSQRDLTNLKAQPKHGSFELTPLHVAVQLGHYNLVEFLAQKYELKNLRYLLHFCVFESLLEKKEIISDKVQIIKLLSTKSSVCINEMLHNGKVPLLQKHVNNELIRCLIECGADVNLVDKNGNSILHEITENPVTPQFYHWLVVSLHERKFKYFNHPNESYVRPIHCAVGKVELLSNTLKYFQLNCANFNAVDGYRYSPLFYAIRGGRSVSLICALIELGANWERTKRSGDTVLHICAKHGHYHAMKHFLKTYKMNVNVKDQFENTPLHFAIMRRSTEYESMQQLLISSGADVNANDEDDLHRKLSVITRLKKASHYKSSCSDSTPFMKALKDGEGLTLSTVKLMEKHGLLIRAKQASKALKNLLSNRKIKSWEIDGEFVGVLKFLIGKGGVIQDIPVAPYSKECTTIWKSVEVQKNMRAIIQATDLDCFWSHLETSRLLTKSELKHIQNHSTDSFNKCERVYELLQSKKGSFERVCILLWASNQISSLELLRQPLLLASQSHNYMFLTPPAFTNQFMHSQHNLKFNKMALVTTNPFLTNKRINETISKSMTNIEEHQISSYLQNNVDDELIVVKVRVVTAEVMSKLEAGRAAQGKIVFVCSAVSEDVENCHVVTDSLPTWEDISTSYIKSELNFKVFDQGHTPIFKLFESPQILNKLSHLYWIDTEFPRRRYSLLRFKIGHSDIEFQSKSYLCHTIFHYFMPDKLVFQRISVIKLKEFARFGHKVGYIGEDEVDNFDFISIEQSHQFDEICKQTSKNVHLVEYEHEEGVFKLVKTWGWRENIQRFLKQKQFCEGFPHCGCALGNQNLFVRFLIETKEERTQVSYFECFLPVNELTPKALRSMKLENAEELFNITALLKRMSGERQVKQTDFIGQSHCEQIIKLVTEHLSIFLVENELYYVAINTLFPNLAEQTNAIEEMEKYQQLGMLKIIENNRMVFVDESLAWYFIAKLLMGLSNTTDLERITDAIRKDVFQTCFQSYDVMLPLKCGTKSYRISVSSQSHHFRSYKLINIMCFRFIDDLLNKSSDRKDVSFRNFIRSTIATELIGYKWIHACVNANLINLLQLILSFSTDALLSEFEFEKLVVLAVNYADVPITRLVAEQFEKKTKRKLTEIKVHTIWRKFSLLHLAAFRGNFGLVEYLLNDQDLRHNLQRHDKLGEVVNYCLEDTTNNFGYELNERKRILDLLLRTDMTLLKQIRLSSGNHLDLIVYLCHQPRSGH